MDAARLRECIAIFGISQRQLAKVLHRREGVVRMWARGGYAIPHEVASWLEGWIEAGATLPPPPLPGHPPIVERER